MCSITPQANHTRWPMRVLPDLSHMYKAEQKYIFVVQWKEVSGK